MIMTRGRNALGGLRRCTFAAGALRSRTLAIFVALAVVGACSRGESGEAAAKGASTVAKPPALPATWPEGAPYITGYVTQFADDTIRIEEQPTRKGGSPKAVLTIDDATLLRGIAGADKPKLRVGQRVSAWVGSRLRESYPVRAPALAIQIVEDTTRAGKR
jgi:hypothetical protein